MYIACVHRLLKMTVENALGDIKTISTYLITWN